MKRAFPALEAPWTAPRRALPLLAAATVAGLLAGCSGSGARLACPQAIVAPDIDTSPLLRPGGAEPQDVQAAAHINAASTRCVREPNGIAVNTHIDFTLLRSDFDVKRADFPYFVAVVDAQRHILNKESFRLDQEYVPRQTFRAVSEDITVHLPLKNPAEGGSYAIVVGFQLTPQQLEFNRKHAVR